MKITRDWLCGLGVSASVLACFEDDWPDGMALTQANLVKSMRPGHMDWGDLVRRAAPDRWAACAAAWKKARQDWDAVVTGPATAHAFGGRLDAGAIQALQQANVRRYRAEADAVIQALDRSQ